MTDPIASAGLPSDTGVVSDVKPTDGGTITIPDEYAEKGYAKDLTSYGDVWKKLDGSQSLIGQKALPDDNSTPEQWNDFYKSTGRPDEAKGYAFNREGFNETFVKNQNEEFDNAVKGIFHKAGLSQKQVSIIQPEVEKLSEAILIDHQSKAAEQDKVFDDLVNKTFGTNKDQILADSSALLKELAPEGFKEKLAGLDNETLVILSGVLNNVRSKYINEDDPTGGGGGGGHGETVDDLRQMARTIMQSDEYRNPFNTKSTEKRQEVAKIYERIAKLQS